MKRIAGVIAMLALSSPAYAQLGGLSGVLKKAQDAKQQLDELVVSEAEERQIGEDVSTKIRERFGVVQDPAIHKYVSLVGMALAQQSDRPQLAWTFIVLDTDGVNAFASPGGFVHVTRGALGLVANEAELAGVLGHENRPRGAQAHGECHSEEQSGRDRRQSSGRRPQRTARAHGQPGLCHGPREQFRSRR